MTEGVPTYIGQHWAHPKIRLFTVILSFGLTVNDFTLAFVHFMIYNYIEMTTKAKTTTYSLRQKKSNPKDIYLDIHCQDISLGLFFVFFACFFFTEE